uniref:Uncharacterized protein n=1 Tax=Solanum lycopersicum TaxID=4081 RepID=A0A3Q7IG41_SOLLC
MKEYFPEWVTIGFSGAIGTFSAIHTIYSWNFISYLKYNGNISDPDIPLPSPVPYSSFGIRASGTEVTQLEVEDANTTLQKWKIKPGKVIFVFKATTEEEDVLKHK